MYNVELKNVSKRYGNVEVIKDLSLAVDEGSFTALLGPSGCGKSTLLRMIAGLEEISQGQCFIEGVEVTDMPPAKRGTAMVFQNYALYPHLTVRQNIAFANSKGWRNPSRASANARVDEWIARFHLQALVDHFPHQISGGQRQRTALARALVHEPAALLLDAPFAALDRHLREQLRQELLELQTQLRLPMLLITHDDEDMAELAEQVVHLAAGRVSSGNEPDSATVRRPLAARVGAAPATPAPAPPSTAAPAIPG